MICWNPFLLSTNDRSFTRGEPWPADAYRELSRRGLAQHISPATNHIALALAMRAAGGRVIMVQGSSGNGPYVFGGHTNALHPFAEEDRPADKRKWYACPLATNAWGDKAVSVRTLLLAYKQAGATVDGVWMDWEGEPRPDRDRWRQARVCPRCRATLPGDVLHWSGWFRYIVQVQALRYAVFSATLGEPVLQVYPDCWITNWEAVFTGPDRPTPTCWGYPLPAPKAPLDIGRLTASNPVAYGNDTYYRWPGLSGWNPFARHLLTTNAMDGLYTRMMLKQVSANAFHAQRMAPEKKCVPWVCRYCPDERNARVPILSRTRYREILRHIWLRGADSMQIFNHFRPERPEIYMEELQDAVAVYDEMLAYVPFLDQGWIMNTDEPGIRESGVLWSGLQLADRCILRAIARGGRPDSLRLAPWPGSATVTLEVPPEGATYTLRRTTTGILAERVPSMAQEPAR